MTFPSFARKEKQTMPSNSLDELREAGIITNVTAQPVMDVLSELAPDEVALLRSLTAKIKAVYQPEVVAHREDDAEDGPCFFGFTCNHGYKDPP
jgi:hypothetical protein